MQGLSSSLPPKALERIDYSPFKSSLITVRDNILARAVVLLGQQDRNDLSLQLGDKWRYTNPLILDEPESAEKAGLWRQVLVSLNKRFIQHVGDQVTEQAALPEQGMDAALGGVVLRLVHSKAFAGGAQ